MTDLELYERVRQKDKEALETLYDRYERIRPTTDKRS